MRIPALLTSAIWISSTLVASGDTYHPTFNSLESSVSDLHTLHKRQCNPDIGHECSAISECCSGHCDVGHCSCLSAGQTANQCGGAATGDFRCSCCSYNVGSDGKCACATDTKGNCKADGSACCDGYYCFATICNKCSTLGEDCEGDFACCGADAEGSQCGLLPNSTGSTCCYPYAGADCHTDSECCSGTCSRTGKCCIAKDTTATCTQTSDCCEGLHCETNSGYCRGCIAENMPCQDSPDPVCCEPDSIACTVVSGGSWYCQRFCTPTNSTGCYDNICCDESAFCDGGTCVTCLGPNSEADCTTSADCCDKSASCTGGKCVSCIATGSGTCTGNSDCCTGNCNATSHTCEACKDALEYCSVKEECCLRSCIGGRCCIGTGSSGCGETSDCCESGLSIHCMTGGICGQCAPRDQPGKCQQHTDCCGVEYGDYCGAGGTCTACSPTQSDCQHDYECCNGSCRGGKCCVGLGEASCLSTSDCCNGGGLITCMSGGLCSECMQNNALGCSDDKECCSNRCEDEGSAKFCKCQPIDLQNPNPCRSSSDCCDGGYCEGGFCVPGAGPLRPPCRDEVS